MRRRALVVGSSIVAARLVGKDPHARVGEVIDNIDGVTEDGARAGTDLAAYSNPSSPGRFLRSKMPPLTASSTNTWSSLTIQPSCRFTKARARSICRVTDFASSAAFSWLVDLRA